MKKISIIREKHYLLLVAAVCTFGACDKNAFLSQKPNSNIVVPTRLTELRGLLENEFLVALTPVLGEQSSDDHYFLDNHWRNMPAKERNAYRWARDVYEGFTFVEDWDRPYEQIYYANVVLDQLSKIPTVIAGSEEGRSIAGAAYFLRARALFALAEVFALPFDPQTAGTLPGLPIRTSPAIAQPTARATIQETYDHILHDLARARASFIDTAFPQNKIRPNRLTVYAQLARVHTAMRQYDKAGAYADSALRLYDVLMDYNTLPVVSAFANNSELILKTNLLSSILDFTTISSTIRLDSTLYASYEANDLRRTLFFRTSGDRVYGRNSYTGQISFFSGLATDELYLIRAESRARAGDAAEALADLNQLLLHRYEIGTFAAYVDKTPAEALELVLAERRKELVWRGLRWSDLRRLNLEGREILPQRIIDGQVYTLPIGSPRYAFPIPPNEISLSHIEQNER